MCSGGIFPSRKRQLEERLGKGSVNELSIHRHNWTEQQAWTSSFLGRAFKQCKRRLPFNLLCRKHRLRRTVWMMEVWFFAWFLILALQLFGYSITLASFVAASVLIFFVMPCAGFCGFLTTKNFVFPLATFLGCVSVWIGGYFLSEWFRVRTATVFYVSTVDAAPTSSQLYSFTDGYVNTDYTGITISK